MIQLEQALQDMHIAEQDTAVGKTWHSLTVPEIERIKEIFIEAGFKPPENLEQMMVGEIIFDRFVNSFTEYVGDAIKSNQFDREVFNHIVELARLATGAKD